MVQGAKFNAKTPKLIQLDFFRLFSIKGNKTNFAEFYSGFHFKNGPKKGPLGPKHLFKKILKNPKKQVFIYEAR